MGSDVGCVDGWNVDLIGELISIVITAEKSKSDPSRWLIFLRAASNSDVVVVDKVYKASLIVVAAAIMV